MNADALIKTLVSGLKKKPLETSISRVFHEDIYGESEFNDETVEVYMVCLKYSLQTCYVYGKIRTGCPEIYPDGGDSSEEDLNYHVNGVFGTQFEVLNALLKLEPKGIVLDEYGNIIYGGRLLSADELPTS